MNDMLWTVGLTIGVYIGFYYLQDRFKISLLNPLLHLHLLSYSYVTNINFETYQELKCNCFSTHFKKTKLMKNCPII